MRTEISSEIEIFDPTDEVSSWCDRELTLENPLFKQLMKRGEEDLVRRNHVTETISFKKRKGSSIRIPFGCLYAIWPYIRKGEVSTKFCSPIKTPLSIMGKPAWLSLYDYQEEAVQALLKAKGGILQAGCGAGKTITAIELIRRIGQRFLWIVHTKDLLRQAQKNFLSIYPNMDIGLITEGKIEIGKDGAISTIQTLAKIDPSEYKGQFNVLVIDECHKCASEISKVRMYDKVLRSLDCRYRYGVTATPFRGDTLGKTIYFNLGCNPNGLFAPTFVVERERTNTMEALFVEFDVDTKESFSYLDGDGKMDYMSLISYLCESKERNAAIAGKVADLCSEGRKIVVLSNRKAHCEELASSISSMGIETACVTGSTKASSRKESIDHPDKWQVLVATSELLKEGLDIKELDTVILTVPLKDKSSVIQACGRCERKLEGKKQPLFIAVRDKNIGYCCGAIRMQKKYIRERR